MSVGQIGKRSGSMLQLLGKNAIIQITDLSIVPRQSIMQEVSLPIVANLHLLVESGFVESSR